MSEAIVATLTPDADSERIASRTVGWSSAMTPTPWVRPCNSLSVSARLSGLKPSIAETLTSSSGRAAPCASSWRASIFMKLLVPAGSTKSRRTVRACCGKAVGALPFSAM